MKEALASLEGTQKRLNSHVLLHFRLIRSANLAFLQTNFHLLYCTFVRDRDWRLIFAAALARNAEKSRRVFSFTALLSELLLTHTACRALRFSTLQMLYTGLFATLTILF